jgi:predicted glycoside hydrolase/deacetylase ChbG (UPF0249 family)
VAPLAALSVGLHLNFTVGAPVADPTAVASLLDGDSGRFLPLRRLLWRVVSGRVRPEHVIRECEAQIDRLRSAGVTITHVDSHRHVHVMPGLLESVALATRRAGIRTLRRPIEPIAGHLARIPATLKKVALAAVWRANRFPADLAGADHFRGLSCRAGIHFESDLLATLDELPSGTTEFMVHPGHGDPLLDQWDSYVTGREAELAGLCSASVAARLSRGDVTLVSFPLA